jgi:hypothetical protein
VHAVFALSAQGISCGNAQTAQRAVIDFVVVDVVVNVDGDRDVDGDA